jgi:hypothetical protein
VLQRLPLLCRRPANHGGLRSDLWHPYPGRGAGTVESVVELLDDLVDTLRRDTEPSTSFGSGDGVVSGESCPFEEDFESCPLLTGDGFDTQGRGHPEGAVSPEPPRRF